MFYQYKVKKM